MRSPTYAFLRKDTGVYFFRWAVPVALRPALGGKKEIKRSLNTDDKRFALRLARRLAVLLDRATFVLMTTKKDGDDNPFNLTVKLLEKMVDGTVRVEGLEMDPKGGEEERKHLEALLGAAGVSSAPTTSGSGKKLSELVAAYLADGDRAERWTSKTRQEMETTYALLAEIVGAEKPLAQVSRADAVQFKETLTKLPSNRNKDARFRGKSALELAAMPIPPADLLKVNTINKILDRVSTLFRWGALHDYVGANYAEGLTLANSKRSDEERDPYSDAEINLLKDALLTGAHGSDRAPYMKWVPLIGMYEGMRLNEICQLALDDFSEVDGIPVITVTDEGEGKRLKTMNSRRIVPVHPELMALGLLDYVKELRSKGATRLFPELSQGRDGYSAIPQKWFGRFRKRIGLQRDFHSLRHSCAVKLLDAGIPMELIADILGHTRTTLETGRYTKAASVARKYEALKKVSYGGKVIAIKTAA